MGLKEIMDTRLFDADLHNKEPEESLRHLVTVGKALELHTSRYWE
jgi:hypothetical protein